MQLRDYFTVSETRTVTNDNTISYEGQDYDMPSGYARQKVQLMRHVLSDNQLWFMHKERYIQLHPTDLHENARLQRAKSVVKKSTKSTQAAQSASSKRFDQAIHEKEAM